MTTIETDICILGGGSGGLSVAAGAVQMGADVVLCEGKKMGGDCLNYGCVPSKSLIESSRVQAKINEASNYGIYVNDVSVDFEKVNAHVKNVINTLYQHDSVERFESLGVKVIQSHGHFINSHLVQAGQYQIKARYYVLATGSSARILPLPGIDEVSYYTNETIFDITQTPDHLIVVGGGPIGTELAQAFQTLGAKVSIVEAAPRILGIADPECTEPVKKQLRQDGVSVYEKANIDFVKPIDQQIEMAITIDDQSFKLHGSHLLLAAGRTPNIQNLKLDQAGIDHSNKGIQVDKRLRTNRKHIYAIGDIATPYQFTHTAGYHAGIVIRNILFKLPSKVDYSALPWVIYVNPELAHVGLGIKEAEKQGARILKLEYASNDRAQAGLHTNGLIKIAVSRKGYILGATITGENAGELISQWTLAIANQLKLKHMASVIMPYPTLSELNKSVAGSYFTPTLYSEKVKKFVRFILKWLSPKIK